MTYILRIPREAVRRSLGWSRAMERRLEVVSRAIWPWHHAWLVPLVALLAALDLLSTYAFLELSGKPDVYESGQLAAWALQRGGFNGLYIMNAIAVGFLCLVAVGAHRYYSRLGLRVFARTAVRGRSRPLRAGSLRGGREQSPLHRHLGARIQWGSRTGSWS